MTELVLIVYNEGRIGSLEGQGTWSPQVAIYPAVNALGTIVARSLKNSAFYYTVTSIFPRLDGSWFAGVINSRNEEIILASKAKVHYFTPNGK